MINIENLSILIDIIPELINLFLPGFIFMCVYTKIFDKQIDISLITIWSLFISNLFETFYCFCHDLFFQSYSFNESTKIFIYIIASLTLPFVIKFLYKKLSFKINHETTNKNIFDDVIDFNKKTMMKVYLKGLNCFYLGTFSMLGESGKDPYISLINYALLDKDTCNVIYKQETSSVVFNLNDVERIELIYEDDSKVWELLNK